jgi:hypothetical protein
MIPSVQYTSSAVNGGAITYSSLFDQDSTYTKDFSVGTGESFFTNTPISFIQNGKPSSSAVTSLDFVLPLMSTLLGVAMPPDRYKMIPMHGFDNMTIELRQNMYAFFTSYFGTNQADREVKITKMELHVNVVYYDDIALNNAVTSLLYEGSGINIASVMWYFVQRFEFQNGVVKKELLCNSGFDSLKLLCFGILSSDYTEATCWRKHYRLSHCISEISVRLGKTYYPSLPIKGNASTSYGGGVNPDNSEFYYQLLLAFGKSDDWYSIFINQSNFAVDDRPYYFTADDVFKVSTDMTKLAGATPTRKTWWSVLNAYGSLFQGLSDNSDLLNSVSDTSVIGVTNGQRIFRICGNSQMSYYWENKVVGKALFCIDFEQANYMPGVVGGFNTAGLKPWVIEVKQNYQSSYNRGSEGYVFACCDVNYMLRGGKIFRSGIN